MSSHVRNGFWTGKTFDDFLFRPQEGISRSRREISLRSRLTSTLTLELPIISANMDSVTGRRMAESMTLEGGLGVIHRALPIEKQVEKVTSVKRSHSAVIEKPFCLPLGATIAEAIAFARRHKIGGILIETCQGSGVLAGVLSHRDIPWAEGFTDRPVDEFMTPVEKLHTHGPAITVEEAERILFEKRIERLPLIDEHRKIHGLITRKDIVFLRKRPLASKDQKGRLLVAAAIGARGDYLERGLELVAAGADCLVIDIAHGHSAIMAQAIEQVRSRIGSVPLICGNVCTYEGARFLKDLGVDAVKVGVGPGRGCRTRLETAAGVPQLQAIREAWAATEDSVPIIADGGIRDDKDIFLALICGASTIMLGSALSGTDEAPGVVIEDPATQLKKKIYRGMTSPEAVLESLYDVEDLQGVEAAFETPAEGQEMQVPYKGSVLGVLGRIRGHLQSAVSYAGELSLADARNKIVTDPSKYLVPLSEASWRESYKR
jgi:IMP dehydrogenase